MTLWTVILRSLRYYGRTNAAVALGVAAAVAVLVGSLVVGDSVQGSLRDIAIERLGRTEFALQAPGLFREALADDIPQTVPLMLIEGAAQNPATGAVVPLVAVLGVTPAFDNVSTRPQRLAVSGRDVVLNRTLADDLGVRAGDDVLLSVGRRGDVPPETAFERHSRQDTLRRFRLTVKSVVPADGLGAFSLRGDRPRPRNLYISLPWLQEQFKKQARVNTILLLQRPPGGSNEPLDARLREAVSLADYGLRIRPGTDNDSFLESDQVVIPPREAEAAGDAARSCGTASSPASVYLANSIVPMRADYAGKGIPYSIVATVKQGGDFKDLQDNSIILTKWAADDIDAKPGDAVKASFYVTRPDGKLTTVWREFKVAGIVPMEVAVRYRAAVPEFEGMTDAPTMAEWNPPFPINLKLIRPKDESYWNAHRTTPKAFVPMDTLRGLWTTQSAGGGWVTAVILRTKDPEALAAFIRTFIDRYPPADAGLLWRPVRTEAFTSANASTDFGMLFLSMSFFLVIAAAALIYLLVRLAVERRASQLGLMLAVGFKGKDTRRVIIGEAFLVALAGVVVGVPLGIGYAWAILEALRGGWSGAAGGFPLSLHVRALSVASGAVLGLVVATIAMLLSSRTRRFTAVTLLGGWQALSLLPRRRTATLKTAAIVLIAVAVVLVVVCGVPELLSEASGFLSAAGLLVGSALLQDAEMIKVGGFMSAGGLLLVGLLALVYAYLGEPRRAHRRFSLAGLALHGARRRPVRSLLTAGLIACATFVIVTVATFQKDPSRLDPRDPASGTGGYDLVVTTAVPIYRNLDTDAVRRSLGFTPGASRRLSGSTVLAFRRTAGDDISCLNIQGTLVPRVLGAPDEFIRRGGFRFAAIDETLPGSMHLNSWTLLDATLPDGSIPAVADAATAQWKLHLGLGSTVEVPAAGGRSVKLRLVGLLADSIFASDLVISEKQFIASFGGDTGFRIFLIRTPEREGSGAVETTLRENLADFGADVTRTGDLLASFARVQNTYLSAFQTLGALGLVLGTFGVVTVLLRNVVERRSELAMMLAVGFPRVRVVRMVLIENATLLLAGVVIGTVGALVATAPEVLSLAADVDWLRLALTLAVVIAVGVAGCAVATRASVRGELIAALRSE